MAALAGLFKGLVEPLVSPLVGDVWQWLGRTQRLGGWARWGVSLGTLSESVIQFPGSTGTVTHGALALNEVERTGNLSLCRLP